MEEISALCRVVLLATMVEKCNERPRARGPALLATAEEAFRVDLAKDKSWCILRATLSTVDDLYVCIKTTPERIMEKSCRVL